MAGVIEYAITLGGKSYRGSAAYTESTEQEIAIATASTNTSLNFGGVTTADVVFILSDQAISINLNSSSETAKTVDANKPVLLTGTALTAVYVTNASGSTANIVFKIWGA